MKKPLILSLYLIFAVTITGTAFAAEKVVQLNTPGCRPCGATARIEKILKKIDGVKKHENKDHDLLIITFDDEKTSLQAIINELKKGDFTVKGEPIYLK